MGAGRQQPDPTCTGPLARLLALVAIVIRALPFMFGESDATRHPTFPVVYEAPDLPLIICIDRRPFLPCPAAHLTLALALRVHPRAVSLIYRVHSRGRPRPQPSRRRQRAVWLEHGQPFPEWVFPSVTGTALDESNVRKAFNRLLDAADLHRRGPHQMRHSFASLLLQDGAPITYVSRQLGHKDPSITLRVYAHWVPDASSTRAVDLLDDAQPSATQAQPTRRQPEWKNALSPYGAMVSQEGIEPSTRRLRVCCSAN
jgi:hypothetical protein